MGLIEEVTYAQAFPSNIRRGAHRQSMTGKLIGGQGGALEKLQALLNAQQLAFNQAQIGRTLPVLFEKLSKRPVKSAGAAICNRFMWRCRHICSRKRGRHARTSAG